MSSIDFRAFFTPQDILSDAAIRAEIVASVLIVRRVFEQCCDFKGVFLSDHLLFEAVGSAFCDLCRLKAFRGIEQADAHKRAAFITKWIAKVRPIQIRHDCKKVVASTLLANELLAFSTSLVVLGIDPTHFLRSKRVQGYLRNSLYLLHFHPSSPEQLASELFLLERWCATRQSEREA